MKYVKIPYDPHEYQDLHDILGRFGRMPANYPLEEVFDDLIVQYRKSLLLDNRQVTFLMTLPLKKQKAELRRMAGILEPALEILESDIRKSSNDWIFELVIIGGAEGESSELRMKRKVAADFIRAALEGVKAWQYPDRGRNKNYAARNFLYHLILLYENFTPGKATANLDFLDFCERCFEHGGTTFTGSGDGRARLRVLVNEANRKDKKGISMRQRILSNWSEAEIMRKNLRLNK